jgi:hypothetical protein
MGFLPRQDNNGNNQVTVSGKTWLKNYRKLTLKNVLATIESLLGPDTVGVTQMTKHIKAVLSIIHHSGHVEEKKTVFCKILSEMTGEKYEL